MPEETNTNPTTTEASANNHENASTQETKAEETVKTFTQEEVNAILAKERKNIEKKGEARKC